MQSKTEQEQKLPKNMINLSKNEKKDEKQTEAEILDRLKQHKIGMIVMSD